jgi:hypothetical protein
MGIGAAMTPEQYNGIIWEIRCSGLAIMFVMLVFFIAGNTK